MLVGKELNCRYSGTFFQRQRDTQLRHFLLARASEFAQQAGKLRAVNCCRLSLGMRGLAFVARPVAQQCAVSHRPCGVANRKIATHARKFLIKQLAMVLGR